VAECVPGNFFITRFRTAVSVLVGPCCPALLNYIDVDVHAVVLKGKVFPYSLPSVGPGADPGVQAVSPQVT